MNADVGTLSHDQHDTEYSGQSKEFLTIIIGKQRYLFHFSSFRQFCNFICLFSVSEESPRGPERTLDREPRGRGGGKSRGPLNEGWDRVSPGKVGKNKKIVIAEKANIDRSAPTIRVQGKRVRAVKKAIAPQVNAAARKVITESATRLLRSSGSAESVAQLTQIAQAIDSTKRILRS